MDVTDLPSEKPRCQGFKKDGTPCPAYPGGVVTPGYCFGHDPGITSRDRSGFAKKTLNVPKVLGKRRFRTITDIKEWAEDTMNDIIGKYPNTIEVVEVQVNIARLLLTAIREQNAREGKKTGNHPKPHWKGVG